MASNNPSQQQRGPGGKPEQIPPQSTPQKISPGSQQSEESRRQPGQHAGAQQSNPNDPQRGNSQGRGPQRQSPEREDEEKRQASRQSNPEDDEQGQSDLGSREDRGQRSES